MSNWYEQMALAMRDRERALSGVERWQAKVIEAEQQIIELTKQRPANDPITAPVTFESGIPADYADSAE
jgi:hypothetical protein